MNSHIIDILIADDNDDDVVMMRKTFSQCKLLNVIHVVENGDEVLPFLRGEDRGGGAPLPGMLFLDLNMPRKNGFEVLKEIKDDPVLKHLPVVILTSSAREEDIIKSYSYGACTFITKPVGLEKFWQVVRQLELYWAVVASIPEPR